MKKKHQLIMLPSNKKAQVGEFAIMLNSAPEMKSYLSCGIIQLPEGYNMKCEKQELYIISDEEIKLNDWCCIKWGTDIDGKDLFEVAQCTKIGPNEIYYFDSMSMCWGKHELNAKKIISTTDISIAIEKSSIKISQGKFDNVYPTEKVILPQLSESFIEKFISEYNKGSLVSEVDVEMSLDTYEYGGKTYHHSDKRLKPRINSDNTINVSFIDNTYSREEVIELIKKFHKETTKDYSIWLDEHDNFINQNL